MGSHTKSQDHDAQDPRLCCRATPTPPRHYLLQSQGSHQQCESSRPGWTVGTSRVWALAPNQDSGLGRVRPRQQNHNPWASD